MVSDLRYKDQPRKFAGVSAAVRSTCGLRGGPQLGTLFRSVATTQSDTAGGRHTV